MWRPSISLAILLPVLALSACDALSPCEKKVLYSKASPDGTREASVVSVACGATTRDAQWVVIKRKWLPFWGEKQVAATYYPDADVDVQWRSSKQLNIHYGNGSPIRHADKVDGVEIDHER